MLVYEYKLDYRNKHWEKCYFSVIPASFLLVMDDNECTVVFYSAFVLVIIIKKRLYGSFSNIFPCFLWGKQHNKGSGDLRHNKAH